MPMLSYSAGVASNTREQMELRKGEALPILAYLCKRHALHKDACISITSSDVRHVASCRVPGCCGGHADVAGTEGESWCGPGL